MIELVQAIQDLGGWGAFLLVVVIAAVGLYRQWFVLGYMYRDWRDEALAGRKTIATLSARLGRERRSRKSDPPDA